MDSIKKELEQVILKRKENLENLQKEGLAILKLKEKLEKANIDFTFIDRKKERMEHADHESIERIKRETPFEYQILIMEGGKKISLVQSPFTYGITQNLIEAYNFEVEPITIKYLTAFDLIASKTLNSFLIKRNEMIDNYFEELTQERYRTIKIVENTDGTLTIYLRAKIQTKNKNTCKKYKSMLIYNRSHICYECKCELSKL